MTTNRDYGYMPGGVPYTHYYKPGVGDVYHVGMATGRRSSYRAATAVSSGAPDYRIALTSNGERSGVYLPVLPKEIQIKQGSKNTTVTIAGLGERTVIQNGAQATFSFSSIFPAHMCQGVSETLQPPKSYINAILDMQASKQPARFIVMGCGVDTFCTIESFDYSEGKEYVGTWTYAITLKEYKPLQQSHLTLSGTTARVSTSPGRVNNRLRPRTYTVKRGDCLYTIARALLGSGARYTDIYHLNRGIIKNPSLLRVGWVLRIP